MSQRPIKIVNSYLYLKLSLIRYDIKSLYKLKEKAAIPAPPHFDERSRNFELDNCNGYGKICLVYGNNPGQDELEPTVWYLDRSLTWHFLASSFTNYYRLLLAHLGLPQWPMLFTPYGLPPSLMVIYRFRLEF